MVYIYCLGWDGNVLMFFTDPCILLPQLQECVEPLCCGRSTNKINKIYKFSSVLFAVRGTWVTWLIHRGINYLRGVHSTATRCITDTRVTNIR